MGKSIKFLFACCIYSFFFAMACSSSSSKKNEPAEFPAKLSEKDKMNFRLQLEGDPVKTFDEEFIRITNLERKLIDKYGYEGIRLVKGIANNSAFYPLGEFPADCPWAWLNKTTPHQFIDSNFRSLYSQLPAMIEAMKRRCHYIYAQKAEDGWELSYMVDLMLVDGRRHFTTYTGGAPNPRSSDIQLPSGWTLPPSLKQFYAVHDGFTEFSGISLLSSREIGVLDPVADRKEPHPVPAGFKFSDFLVVIDYASDYEECIQRKHGQMTGDRMAEWDEDVWEITPKGIDFFSFLDELFGHPDEL